MFKALLDTGASTSLIEDEVVSRLERNGITLRKRNLQLQLARLEAYSGWDARLLVRWNQRRRRQRFTHLAGLTVTVILGRDFLAKRGIVMDVGNGGYRESPFMPLKPFATPSAAMTQAPPAEVERRNSSRENKALPQVWNSMVAVRLRDLCADREEKLHVPFANSGDLTEGEQSRILSLLRDLEMFTDRPGGEKKFAAQHRNR